MSDIITQVIKYKSNRLKEKVLCNKRGVYVVNEKGDLAVKRSISIGRQNPRYYEVLEGLNPGEQVIVSSYDNFNDVDQLILK